MLKKSCEHKFDLIVWYLYFHLIQVMQVGYALILRGPPFKVGRLGFLNWTNCLSHLLSLFLSHSKYLFHFLSIFSVCKVGLVLFIWRLRNWGFINLWVILLRVRNYSFTKYLSDNYLSQDNLVWKYLFKKYYTPANWVYNRFCYSLHVLCYF